MRRLLIAAILLLLPFTLSCSDSTGSGDDGQGEIIDSATIGSQGGAAGDERISLDIPPGAFGSETSILLTTAPEKPFEGTAVSGTYWIMGLPQDYAQDLTVSVSYEGELSDSSYIAVGMESFVSSLGEMITTYSLIPATAQDGTLTAIIPAMRTALDKVAQPGEETPVTLSVTPVTSYKPHVTAQGHFKIEYAPRFTTEASVQQLGQYLEEAYTTIAGLGFSYGERTNWPVSVTVKMLDDEVFGYSANSLWGDNYGYLEFNSKKMSDLDEMRITAGHEFFHLVQSLYDPRNFYAKAKLSPPQHWLSEAAAVWVEEKFTGEQNYVSAARAGNNMAPFEGVETGAALDAGRHGYGMSAMIKYLVEEYGETCVVTMYEAIRNESSPLAAVATATEDPVVWWDTFLRRYMRGEIYNVSLGEMTANKSGMFQASYDSDTLATFTGAYPDLSGKLYVIRLEHAAFDKGAVLTASIGSDFGELSLFKYKINPLAVELIGTDGTSVTVSDLRSLQGDGWHLIALVSNSRNIPPYNGSSTITTTIRITKPADVPSFNWFTLHPELLGDFTSTLSGDYTTMFTPSLIPSGPGTLTGTTFTGTRNEPWNGGTITGSYTITFDAAFSKVLSIEVTQNFLKPGFTASDATSYQNVSFSAHDIPISYIDGDFYTYQLWGNDITDHITSMSFEYGIEGEQHTELVDYHSGGGGNVVIRLMVLD